MFRSRRGFLGLLLGSILLVLASSAHALANRSRPEVPEIPTLGTRTAVGDNIEQVEKDEMQSLLNWALEHSDPEKLKALAAEVEAGVVRPELMDIDHVLKQRKKIKETMEYLEKMNPSQALLMREAIAIVNKTTGLEVAQEFLEDTAEIDPADAKFQFKALDQLSILVEPIDNANDLPKMGAFPSMFRSLARGPTQAIQCAALEIVRVAASNNPSFVEKVMEAQPKLLSVLETLARGQGLMPEARDEEDNCDVRVKALMTLSNLLRADEATRASFLSKQGDGLTFLEEMLNAVLNDKKKTKEGRMESKVLALIEDLYSSGSLTSVPMKDVESLSTLVIHRLVQVAGEVHAKKVGPGEWEVHNHSTLDQILRASRAVLLAVKEGRALGGPDKTVVSVAHRMLTSKALKEVKRAAKNDPDAWTELSEFTGQIVEQLYDRMGSPNDDVKGLL